MANIMKYGLDFSNSASSSDKFRFILENNYFKVVKIKLSYLPMYFGFMLILIPVLLLKGSLVYLFIGLYLLLTALTVYFDYSDRKKCKVEYSVFDIEKKIVFLNTYNLSFNFDEIQSILFIRGVNSIKLMDYGLSQMQLIYKNKQYVLAYEISNKNLYLKLDTASIQFLNSNFKVEVFDD